MNSSLYSAGIKLTTQSKTISALNLFSFSWIKVENFCGKQRTSYILTVLLLIKVSCKFDACYLSLMSIGLLGEQSVASCLLPEEGETMVSLMGCRGLQESSSV